MSGSTDFVAAQRRNRRKTLLLLGLLTLLAAGVGFLLGSFFDPRGSSRAAVAGAAAMTAASIAWSVVSLIAGDRLVLGAAHARPIPPSEQAQLRNVVEEMALAAGLPVPRLAMMDVPDMNAFSTGTTPQRATLVVTRGLVEGLERAELQGVVAHEMAHIANHETRYMTVVSATVGLIVMVGDMIARPFARDDSSQEKNFIAQLLLMVLAFVGIVLSALITTAAKAVQLAVSLQREYLADATAVQFTRNPEGLISALVKLAATARPFPGVSHATQHLFIVSPLHHDAEPMPPLLATHPTVADRILRLRNLGL